MLTYFTNNVVDCLHDLGGKVEGAAFASQIRVPSPKRAQHVNECVTVARHAKRLGHKSGEGGGRPRILTFPPHVETEVL